ncbi:putative colanic acid biosysnthesis UDP-glucose lipid carrier transferase [Methylomarinovum tepidoasis]|uniref:Colanic acid biosysnthesis UDP-glucose lipid carrier transferase n=1 Tax=Methylomarinovum tepidoasis TaxID=2840183 RepID=A0AAU9CUL7_9GAMM|nr:undecaprenyl-phosphate glucose phosphotransferase [Methylomarinovum sp. IN45]BCX87779.1 putative colanic acid biosysnthesis UDP-glucose lipid carrier transferase [Methylomarinovum sp. IN45]
MNESSVNRVIRPHHSKLTALVRLLDNAAIFLSLLFLLEWTETPVTSPYIWLGIGGSFLFGFFAEALEVYQSWRGSSFYREARRLAFAWICAIAVLIAVLFLTKTATLFSRKVVLLWFVTALVLLIGLYGGRRLLLAFFRNRGRNRKTVAIVGANALGKRLQTAIAEMPWLGYQFVGYYDDREPGRLLQSCTPLLGDLKRLYEDARHNRIDCLFITLPMSAEKRIRSILSHLGDSTISVFYVPNFFVFDLIQSRWDMLQGIPVISVYDTPFRGVEGALKRAEDLVLGSLILLLISLPMLIIAIGVKLSSPGPVIFKQRRYGFNGQEIIVWKFRTMTVCEDGEDVKQAKKNDARVTRFGAFLRRTSLDELPQFINVLQGTMSIVGPRPHAVAHNEQYRRLIPGYMLRHKVKPGITGLAQINGFRGETDTLDKMAMRVRHDIEYIRHWSLWLDLKIIFLTIFKGFRSPNAY